MSIPLPSINTFDEDDEEIEDITSGYILRGWQD